MGTAVFPFSNNLARIISHAKVTGDPVLLVKDQGLYLMCRGLAAEEGKPNRLCAYALGCDPSDKSGPDSMGWYDRAREIAGGDDFAEEISDARVLSKLISEGSGLKVEISESHLTVTTETR